MLKAAFSSRFVPGLIAGEDTHDSARGFIGLMVRWIPEKDRLAEIIGSLLPVGYSGNTLEEIPALVKGALKKGFGEKKEKRRICVEKQQRQAFPSVSTERIAM